MVDPNTLKTGDRIIIERKGSVVWGCDTLFQITKASSSEPTDGDVRLEFKAVQKGDTAIKKSLVNSLGFPTWGRGSEYDFYAPSKVPIDDHVIITDA